MCTNLERCIREKKKKKDERKVTDVSDEKQSIKLLVHDNIYDS
jgi:hypothetical protein